MTTYDDDRPRLSLVKPGDEVEPVPATTKPGTDVVRRVPKYRQTIENFATGDPAPVVEEWITDPIQRQAMLTGFAQFTLHRVKYHGARSPIYACLFAIWAPRGVWRGVRWLYWYIQDEEAQARARNRPPGDPMYKAETDIADRHLVPRLWWVGFLGLCALVAIVIAYVKLPWPLWDLCVLGGFIGAAYAGRPLGRRMFKPAVVQTAVLQVTPAAVVDALGKLGIPDLNKAIKDRPDTAVRFPGVGVSRDHIGMGTLVQCELPLGCTAQDVINKRPKLASAFALPMGRTWLSTDPQESPSYLEIWLPDVNMNRRKQPRWPYLDGSIAADYFTEFEVGRDEMNRPVKALLDQSGSIFAGQSGFGKTSGAAAFLYYSAMDPIVEHWILDLAGKGDYRDAKAFASRLVAGQSDEHLEAGLYMLRDLRQEVRVRAEILESLDPAVRGPEVRVIRSTAHGVKGLHPLHFVGDEIQELFSAEDDKLAKEARKLARDCSLLGRALGVHIQMATQEPTQTMFPVALRRNLRIRVLYRVTAPATDRIVLGDDAADAGVTSTQFTVADMGISNVVGSSSHIMSPATVCQWVNLDGPARAGLALRARAIREATGMLRGEAAGIVTERVPDVPARDFLDDAYAVTLGRRNVWTENLLTLLVAVSKPRYEGWTAEQLSASFREHGVKPEPVHDGPLDGNGKAYTRNGYKVPAIARAYAEATDEGEGEE